MTADRKPGPAFVATLASITLIGPLAIHLFLPAMPSIRADFAISEALAQLTLAVALYVMAFLTLIYGGVSDRYGRRPVVMITLYLFLAGTAVAAVADNIAVLIAGRALQAAGAAGSLALARAMARDVFGADRFVKVLAYLTMAYTLGPMVSPLLGGALVDEFGWRAVFAVGLVAGGAITLAAYVVLYETHPARGRSAGGPTLAAGYARLLRSPRFLGFVFQSGFSSGSFFVVAAGSVFLMSDYLHRPAAEYGLYFLAFPFGFILGNFLSSRLSGRIAIETMVLTGGVCIVAAGAIETGFVLAGVVTPLTIFGPGFLLTLSQGLAMPNAQAGAIGIDPALAGTASGIGVFVQLFLSASMAQLVGLVADGTPYPMVTILSATTLLSLASGAVPFVLSRRSKDHRKLT